MPKIKENNILKNINPRTSYSIVFCNTIEYEFKIVELQDYIGYNLTCINRQTFERKINR